MNTRSSASQTAPLGLRPEPASSLGHSASVDLPGQNGSRIAALIERIEWFEQSQAWWRSAMDRHDTGSMVYRKCAQRALAVDDRLDTARAELRDLIGNVDPYRLAAAIGAQ